MRRLLAPSKLGCANDQPRKKTMIFPFDVDVPASSAPESYDTRIAQHDVEMQSSLSALTGLSNQTSALNQPFHLPAKSHTSLDRRGRIPADNLANVAAQLPHHTISKMQNLGACSRDDGRRESQRPRSLICRAGGAPLNS